MTASGPAPAANGRCLNCATPLSGPYCAACGQAAQLKPLSLRYLLLALAGEIFDVDSKAWRSFLPLLFRPGHLTRQYIAGRRARYVGPVRLYLATSVLFFVFAALTDSNIPISWNDGRGQDLAAEPDSPGGGFSTVITRQGGCDVILAGADSQWAEYWRERVVAACWKVSADKGVSLERAAVDNIPVMMVIFIPVLALVMKLLYPLSRRYYAEHVVFFLHYHAFAFIALLLIVVAHELGTLMQWSATTWRGVASAGTACLALYLLLAMRRVYGQGYVATLAKFCVLFVAYLTGLVLSLTGVILYTALTL
jgi:hypothetical protein